MTGRVVLGEPGKPVDAVIDEATPFTEEMWRRLNEGTRTGRFSSTTGSIREVPRNLDTKLTNKRAFLEEMLVAIESGAFQPEQWAQRLREEIHTLKVGEDIVADKSIGYQHNGSY